jgi:hypothetical protein
MHDMAKPLTRVLVATNPKNLCCGQEFSQRAGQEEGNWWCGLQGEWEEDSPKRRKDRVGGAHTVLLVNSWCCRVLEVEARSNFDFHKVHERLQRVLRMRSNKNHEIDCDAR